MKKLERTLRIESWLTTVMNLDVYFKEMKMLHIASMKRIKNHHNKIIAIDTASEDYDSAEEDFKNAEDDCEHIECHRTKC